MLEEINCKYILSQIFQFTIEKIRLNIIKYNKKLKEKLNVNLNDYIRIHNHIEIEIIPIENQKLQKEENIFINYNKENKHYIHIYFNNNYFNEITRNYIIRDENVNIIKIILEPKTKSFKELFKRCYCIKEINFIKFYRKDISDMSYLFCGCSYLDKLNITKIDTRNVTNMSGMFWGCSLLKEFNLSNFNTLNVTNMHCLFNFCSSIKQLNLSNFNTEKVTDMSNMFESCESLEKLNLLNFNVINVTNMCAMFSKCYSLKEINIPIFNLADITCLRWMFYGCSKLINIDITKFIFNVNNDIKSMFSVFEMF